MLKNALSEAPWLGPRYLKRKNLASRRRNGGSGAESKRAVSGIQELKADVQIKPKASQGATSVTLRAKSFYRSNSLRFSFGGAVAYSLGPS
jgi:hypothetical protein